MKQNTNPVKGMNDYLPTIAELRQKTTDIILSVYTNNGFMQIKTPVLENLSLLNNSEGGDNLRLIFQTIKRKDKLKLDKPSLTEDDIIEEGLRYDLTVPLVRYFANNKEKLPLPFKSIQIGDAYRAENPQHGRFREFTQCDIDILGDDSINAEIELLIAIMQAYEKLGIKNLTIKINSREVLNNIILKSGFNQDSLKTVCVSLDKFDKIGLNGIKAELISKSFDEAKIDLLFNNIKTAKPNDAIINIINMVRKFIPTNYNIVFDIFVIRGQGYYTGTVFEVYSEGFNGAIGGGGRYDNLVEKILGTPVPAVGISIGLDRVLLCVKSQNIELFKSKKIAIIYENKSLEDVLQFKQKLMKDYDVSIFKRPKNLNNLLNKLKENTYIGFVNFDVTDNIKEI